METVTVPLPDGTKGTLVAINRYIVLGIDTVRHTTILAAAAYSEVEAEMLGLERKQNQEMPYDQWKVFVWGEHTEKQIRDWLKTWDFTSQHARKVWRDTLGNMTKLIADSVKHQHKDQLFPKPKPMSEEKRRAFARAKSRRR